MRMCEGRPSASSLSLARAALQTDGEFYVFLLIFGLVGESEDVESLMVGLVMLQPAPGIHRCQHDPSLIYSRLQFLTAFQVNGKARIGNQPAMIRI